MGMMDIVSSYFKLREEKIKKIKDSEKINKYVNQALCGQESKPVFSLNCPFCEIKKAKYPRDTDRSSVTFYDDISFIEHLVQYHKIEFTQARSMYDVCFVLKSMKLYNFEI